jgi:hypothetical protein
VDPKWSDVKISESTSTDIIHHTIDVVPFALRVLAKTSYHGYYAPRGRAFQGTSCLRVKLVVARASMTAAVLKPSRDINNYCFRK